MKYFLTINDEERRSNGDESSFSDVKDNVEELLRMGYFEVEQIDEAPELPACGDV